MKISILTIPEVLIIEPTSYFDSRGSFTEVFRKDIFEDFIQRKINFVQQNMSLSPKNTLRGLHFQKEPFEQAKLIWVLRGEIFDVAVDIRPSSPSFGEHVSAILSHTNKKQMWIPEGFAHGFLVLSEKAEVFYQTNQYYQSNFEQSILWSDPQLNIDWPETKNLIISDKDQLAKVIKVQK